MNKQPPLIMRQLFDRSSCTYTYIVKSSGSSDALLIDPVLEHVSRDISVLSNMSANLTKILNTHVHADHVTGSGALKERLGSTAVQTFISRESGAVADVLVTNNDKIDIGDGRFLTVRSTPGHTPGCISFETDDQASVFVGDAVLIGGCGRTDFQGGDSAQLYDSVKEKILSLPDETNIWPGHDYNGRTVSTVKEENTFNPRLTLKKSEFVNLMDTKFDGSNYPSKIDASLPANMVCGVFSETTKQPVLHPGGFLWVPEKFKPDKMVKLAERVKAGAVICDLSSGEGGTYNGDSLDTPWHENDHSLFLSEFKAKVPDFDAPVILCCKTGKRASKGCALLEMAGYRDLTNGINLKNVAEEIGE
ncbi:hypothetical protein TL16_g04415 [Triparma laevis f. inornata]|uniref:persulfide dioxygenase n=1 Tax=Triparma laevis f. inornata TaxID=1714386 RepID=A0A9W7ADG8_9STRA|nr:hypothetical protein TL16_g04415 [Triparma laevis f. inornata]